LKKAQSASIEGRELELQLKWPASPAVMKAKN
jgi:hypothetical protein